MNKKLLRKKLALMLATLKKKRKFFCEVEYLESTGTQYIDTGIKSSGSLKVELIAESKTTSGSCNIFGVYSTNDDCLGIFQQASTLTYAAQYRYIGTDSGRIVSNVNSPNNKITAVLDKGAFYINGNLIGSKTYYNFSSTQNLLLFALNREPGAGIIGPNPAKVWLCKIWDNDTLVRDMIPVLDWDMTPCMYDKVTGQLFYNAGTGNFTAGREIHQVDYIQTIYSSSGNSFIDTGYYPNFNTKVEFMASGISADTFAGSPSGTWLTGGRQAYLQKMFGSYYNPSYQRLYFGFSTSLNDASYSTANMYGDNKKFVLDKTGLYINDTKIVNNTNTTAFTSPATLAIFGLNNNGTMISPTSMKIQYYKIWDNDVLTRDYIPMVDENGVGALFDKVTHTIYDAVGTGTGFKYPPVELDYLESSGTQYIDTGVAGSSTLKIEMIAQKTGSSLGVYFGAGTGNNRIQAVYFSDYNNARIGNINSNLGPDSEKFDIVCDVLNKNVIYNGTSYPFAYTSALTNLNIFIFTRNEGGSYADKSTAKCWLFKIYDNGTLVRDFIPCYKDGVLGMLDKVNSVFYQNAGTGTFIKGRIVEPEYE